MSRRPITLIEILVVITIIGIITGALAFNARGALDQGKAFASQEKKRQIEQVLQFAMDQEELSLQETIAQAPKIVKSSPLLQGESILKDAWGYPFEFRAKEGTIVVDSEGLRKWRKRKDGSHSSK